MQIKLHITVDQLVECLGKKALRTIRSLDGGLEGGWVVELENFVFL
jgi:hypothetical protein